MNHYADIHNSVSLTTNFSSKSAAASLQRFLVLMSNVAIFFSRDIPESLTRISYQVGLLYQYRS